MRAAIAGLVILTILAVDTFGVSRDYDGLPSTPETKEAAGSAITSHSETQNSDEFGLRVNYETRLEQRVHELLNVRAMEVKVNVEFDDRLIPVDAWAVVRISDSFLRDVDEDERRNALHDIRDAVALLLPRDALHHHFTQRSLNPGFVHTEITDHSPRVHIFWIPGS